MKRLPVIVVVLGFASFFTDFSSEMIYPLLPAFLVTVLGAGALQLGIIEGVAESTASIFKLISGLWTDRVKRRKPFLLAGYGLAGIVRPLIGLAATWPFVLAMRFMDRIGKGLRTSPRDALIADVTDPSVRGTAYGFHRAMDHAGAVIGPLTAAGLIALGFTLRNVFLLAAVPAAVVMIVLFWGIKEKPVERIVSSSPIGLAEVWRNAGRDFKLFLMALLVFALGNSTDAFLLFRLRDVGVPDKWVAILWAAHHVVKMFSTYIGGIYSDKFGRRWLIVFGWLAYAGVYVGFAMAQSATFLIVLFLGYGLYYGLTEPSEKAWTAEMIPAKYRGSAFGFYHAVIGLGALPASIIFGLLWQRFGAATAFCTGSALALAASVLIMVIPRSRGAES